MPKETRWIGIIFLAFVLIGSLIAPAATTRAEGPDWNEGDVWAMGYEEDMSSDFLPPVEDMDDLIDGLPIEEIDYDIDGKVGFYSIYEITEENPDGYVMEMESGGGVRVEGYFEMTAELPEEGEHDLDRGYENISTEKRTIRMEGEFKLGQSLDGTIVFDNDHAVESMDLEFGLELRAGFDAEGFPIFDEDLEEETVVVRYEDFSLYLEADIGAEIDLGFEPALDLFEFPIEEGSWEAQSEMTISGSYHGVIDLEKENLPEELEEIIEEFQDETGEDFPIIIEELETDEDWIEDGEIKEKREELSVPVRCTGTEEVELHDGSVTEAYVIEFGQSGPSFPPEDDFEPTSRILFSEEEGFIVGQDMDTGEVPDELGETNVRMRSMEEQEAREKMLEMREIEEESLIPLIIILAAIIVTSAMIAVLLFAMRGKSPEPVEGHDEAGWRPEERYGPQESSGQPRQRVSEQRTEPRGRPPERGPWER